MKNVLGRFHFSDGACQVAIITMAIRHPHVILNGKTIGQNMV
jgi:hypothetical protein